MNTARRVMRTPRTVDIDLTARCNLRCRYCYFFDNPAVVYEDLPTDEWIQFFDELGECGVMDVCLAGGEPFIREDLVQLLKGIVRNRMMLLIFFVSLVAGAVIVQVGRAAEEAETLTDTAPAMSKERELKLLQLEEAKLLREDAWNLYQRMENDYNGMKDLYKNGFVSGQI